MTDQRSAGLLLRLAGLGFLLNGSAWLLAFLFPRHESAAILHYTSSVGIDFVGTSRHILILPGVGALILILNLLVGRLVFAVDPRTAWVLWSTGLIIQIILNLSLIFLISLNR